MPYVYRKLPASLERREKIYMLRNNDIEICNKWHQKKHIGKNQFAAIFFFRQGHQPCLQYKQMSIALSLIPGINK